MNRRTSTAVTATSLIANGTEAMEYGIGGRARFVAATAGLGTGIAAAANARVRVVSGQLPFRNRCRSMEGNAPFW
jgi:hypothetical protein